MISMMPVDRTAFKPPESPQATRSTTLDTLPKELVFLISTHLDRTSAIELARVSRAFTHLLSETLLWRSLSLHLPRHYGETPSILPLSALDDLDRTQERAVIKVCQVALRQKTNLVLCRGDEQKWAKVKDIELDPRPGNLLGMMQILDLASSSLTALEIQHRPPYDPSHNYATLDIQLLDAEIHFPSLSFVHIGAGINCSSVILILLCNTAPGLTSINVTFDMVELGGSDMKSGPWSADVGVFARPTQITTARFALTGCPDQWEDSEALSTLTAFLVASPHLRELSLPHDGLEEYGVDVLMDILAVHPGIEDLHWPIDLGSYADALQQADATRFPKLRRLILSIYSCTSWPQVLDGRYSTPALEELYIDASELHIYPLPLEKNSEARSIKSSSAQTMIIPLVYCFEDCPVLHTVHTFTTAIDLLPTAVDGHDDMRVFERLEALVSSSGRDSLGHASSVQCNGHELLHARFGMHIVETSDVPLSLAPDRYKSAQLRYSDQDDEARVKLFEHQSNVVWHDYTHYQGVTVPLEVIERMRIVAGISMEGWRRRHVEVDEKAWAVLEEWLEWDMQRLMHMRMEGLRQLEGT